LRVWCGHKTGGKPGERSSLKITASIPVLFLIRISAEWKRHQQKNNALLIDDVVYLFKGELFTKCNCHATDTSLELSAMLRRNSGNKQCQCDRVTVSLSHECCLVGQEVL